LGGTIVLLVLGLLVLIPSGLCTSYFGIAGIVTMFDAHDQGYGVLFLGGALIFGGPFVAAGIAMLWIGIKRWRARS
jgi:hypothetical protein